MKNKNIQSLFSNKEQEVLEQYIKNNLQAFDEKPANGHFERFQKKQDAERRKKYIRPIITIAAAASVILLLSISIFYPNPPVNDPIVVCEQSDDMKACYLSKMNDIVSQIEVLTKDFSKWDKQTVQSEVDYIIESANEAEQMIPETLPANESKQILAGCYEQNIESLQTIAQLVHENNNGK